MEGEVCLSMRIGKQINKQQYQGDWNDSREVLSLIISTMRRTPVGFYFTVKNSFGNLAALNTYQKLEVNICAIEAACIHQRRGNSRLYILCKDTSLMEQQQPTHPLISYSPLLNAVVNSWRNTLLRNTTVAYLTLKNK